MPAIPSRMVIMNPPGSRPGIRSLAITPMIRPDMINAMILMVFQFLSSRMIFPTSFTLAVQELQYALPSSPGAWCGGLPRRYARVQIGWCRIAFAQECWNLHDHCLASLDRARHLSARELVRLQLFPALSTLS